MNIIKLYEAATKWHRNGVPLSPRTELALPSYVYHFAPPSIPIVNPLMPNGVFNLCCPRDWVSRHNGGTSGAPLKPLRVDSAPVL